VGHMELFVKITREGVSVCVSVTFVHCVKTNKHILKIFSPSKGEWPGLRDPCHPFIIFKPLNIFGRDEATLFKFGMHIDYARPSQEMPK